MKPFYTILLAVLLSVGVVTFVLKPHQATLAKQETVFDRVMRTRELRCGYYVYPPATYRDPNTKELSGLSVDIMNEIGKRAGIKIIWAEEYGLSGWTQALTSNRFDVACTPNWPDIPTADAVSYSMPLYYASLYPVVRSDDKRFVDGNLQQFNSPSIIFSVIEGEASASLIPVALPKAKVRPIAIGSETSAFLMDLKSKKTDAVLLDQNGLYQANKSNPGIFRMIKKVPPIKVQSFALANKRGEPDLKDWVDNAILDLQYDGTVDRLLNKWEAEPGKTYERLALPVKREQ